MIIHYLPLMTRLVCESSRSAGFVVLMSITIFSFQNQVWAQTSQPQTAKPQTTQATKSTAEEDLSRLRPDDPKRISPGELEASIARGVKHLVDSQNKNGSWGGPQWTGGVDNDPVPGSFRSFDIAVTAMCLEALIDVAPTDDITAANEKAYQFLISKTNKIQRAGRGDLPHIWAHCYCIQTFSKLHGLTEDVERKKEMTEAIKVHLSRLKRWQSIHGGWFYYGSGMSKPINPSCSFVNSAVLVASARARDIGIDGDQKTIDRALKATRMMRKPDGSFLYTARVPGDMRSAGREINRPAGSLGRTQSGNAALRLWKDEKITDEVIRVWLDRMVTRHGWLDMGRKKPIPHESFAQVAGYFYYFGVYYATECVDLLPEKEQAFYQHHLARLIMDRQEKDGSWFDYPLYSYHKPYGTAFALLGLQRCRVKQK